MENNKNESLEDFMKRKLEKRYGTGNVNTSKMGINCKIDISQSKKIYILKYDGNIKEVPRIEKSAETDVYSFLDDGGTLHIRATEKDGYKKASRAWNNYFAVNNTESVIKAEFEEIVAPSTVGDMFHYLKNLKSIENIKYLHTENSTNMASMFCGCENLEKIDVSGFDTSNVTNMASIFLWCYKLKELDISTFDTNNVNSMERMFNYDTILNELDLSNFSTEQVTKMNSMFSNCNNLKNLNIRSFNTNKVETMEGMFNGCNNLTNLDLTNFSTSNVNTMKEMFNGCSSLTQLDLSSFNTTNVESMRCMFFNCGKLTNLDLSHFDTKNVNDFYCIFYGCHGLRNVNLLGKFKIDDQANYNGFFCYISGSSGIKIKTTQDTADKTVGTGSNLTIKDNFEIVE